MDGRGRVWLTDITRAPDNPAFCKKGSSNPSAVLFPLEKSNRQVAVYDPETRQFTLANLCFSTHHLMFTEDGSNTLWFSGGGDVVGWFNTARCSKRLHDAEKSQGWGPPCRRRHQREMGKRDAYVEEPGQPLDPANYTRVRAMLLAFRQK